jgi:hypothetical protein
MFRTHNSTKPKRVISTPYRSITGQWYYSSITGQWYYSSIRQLTPNVCSPIGKKMIWHNNQCQYHEYAFLKPRSRLGRLYSFLCIVCVQWWSQPHLSHLYVNNVVRYFDRLHWLFSTPTELLGIIGRWSNAILPIIDVFQSLCVIFDSIPRVCGVDFPWVPDV